MLYDGHRRPRHACGRTGPAGSRQRRNGACHGAARQTVFPDHHRAQREIRALVHALLLQSQGLTVERPARTTGTLIGAGASALALLLGIALLVKALDWPVSFPQFLAFFGASLLLPLSLLFGFWAYGCYTLRYAVGQTGLTVGWGTMRHFIPMHTIEKLIPGRGEQRPRPGGL